jgi:hypothetical protein
MHYVRINKVAAEQALKQPVWPNDVKVCHASTPVALSSVAMGAHVSLQRLRPRISLRKEEPQPENAST